MNERLECIHPCMHDDTIGRETIHVPRDDDTNDDSIRDATRPGRFPPLARTLDENDPTNDDDDDDGDRDHAGGLF